MPFPVSRETLYEEIWKEPAVTVAARYSVSSSFLARVCAEMNLPRPARGHWAKLAVGKAPTRPPLPPAQPGDAVEWTRGEAPRRTPRALPTPPAPRSRRKPAVEIRRDTAHPVVADAKDDFLRGRVAESGHLRPSRRRLPDLYVSQETLERALTFASALFWELEARGYRVALGSMNEGRRPALDERKDRPKRRDQYEHSYGKWAPDRPTVTYVGSVCIGLTIFEQSERTEVQYVNGKYVPVSKLPQTKRRGYQPQVWTHHKDLAFGRLCIRASSAHGLASWEQYWEESDGKPLEGSIGAIVRALTTAAPVIAELVKEGAARREAERIQWERQREIWRKQQEEQDRKRRIEESRGQLAEIISVWATAKAREEFFEDLAPRAALLPPEEQTAVLERLEQARALLGTPDALKRFSAWRSPSER